MVTREGLYQVTDVFIARRILGIALESPYRLTSVIKAKWTGEKRPPRKGEWYLSGAEIGAYYAHNDLTTPYHIAKIVKTKTVTIVVEDES